MKNLSSIILLFTSLFSGAFEKQELQLLEVKLKSNTFIIDNIDVFNGKENKIYESLYLLIEDGIIKQIENVSCKDQSIPRIDGTGKVLMPGFIDAHVHLSGSGAVPWANEKADIRHNLEAYLYAGVTSIYDLGGISNMLEKISNKIDKGKLYGPDLFHTHIPMTVENSHPIPLTRQMLPWPLRHLVNQISPTIDSPEEAQKLIKKYLKNDIDYVKLICDQIPPGSPEMTYLQMKALVDASHVAGKKVIAHIGSPENAITAIRAGVDALAHGIWRGKLTPEQADEIASAKIPVIYTAAGFKNVGNIYHGRFCPTHEDTALVSPKVLTSVTGENGKKVREHGVFNEFFEDVSKNEQYWESNFKLLKNRGVQILVGTDSNLPGTYAGSTYLQELKTLSEMGMSNFELLRAATYLNAHLFLENPNFGSIELDKKAHFIILNDNPLENLETIHNPVFIVKGECVFVRK